MKCKKQIFSIILCMGSLFLFFTGCLPADIPFPDDPTPIPTNDSADPPTDTPTEPPTEPPTNPPIDTPIPTPNLWNYETKILASDGQAGDVFGAWIQITEEFAVLSSRFDNNNAGAVYVYSIFSFWILQKTCPFSFPHG